MPTARPRTRARKGLHHYLRGQVLTSSELIGRLQQDGFSDVNARQVLRRGADTDGVWRSEKLRLARDERLFAEKSFVDSPEFFVAVGKKLRKTNRHGLARCLTALGQHRVLNKVDVLRLLAVSPESRGMTLKRLYDSELEGLRELGVRVIQHGTPLESLVSPMILDGEELDEGALVAAKRLRNTALLARILTDRLRRQNLVSWNRIDVPDLEVPYTVFNGQVFSAYAFSYLSPLARWKQGSSQPTPCPVLVDCYDGVCGLPHVHSFQQRIERATLRGRSRLQVLGVIAARDFERDAWKEARRQGLITVSFRQMFGDEALDAMILVGELLYGLKREGARTSEKRFRRFAQLLEALKTNPVVTALRSIGLEALSGLILRSRGYEEVELGRIVPWANTTRDVDVFGFRDGELYVIECKAYHRRKSIQGEDVRKFFTQTLPAVKKWLRKNERSFSRCTAEIWTTGPLGNEARDELHSLKSPDGDHWELKRIRDMEDTLPSAIRNRSIELFRAIAIAETDEGQSGEGPASDIGQSV